MKDVDFVSSLARDDLFLTRFDWKREAWLREMVDPSASESFAQWLCCSQLWDARFGQHADK